MSNPLIASLLCLFLPALSPIPADERPDSEWRYGLDAQTLSEVLEQLTEEKRVPTDLRIGRAGGQLVFDLRIGPNPDDTPWIALVNLNPGRFRKAGQEHEAAGYRLAVHTSIRANRRTWHSAVWVREPVTATLEIPDEPLPEQGATADAFAPLDNLMRQFLADHHLPGATLAVARNGQLVYSRGFGWADLAAGQPMPADARMRIASVSKPITAVAVLQLAAAGRLDLDTPVLDLLTDTADGERWPEPKDERWRSVTIRHLLQHTGGWDRDQTPDPMFQTVAAGKALGLTRPPTANDLIRYQMLQPLDFDPGTRYAYSNLGYCLLGRVIERVTGASYNASVADAILRPAGMQQTVPGRTRREFRRDGEVVYYTQQQEEFPAFWIAHRSKQETTGLLEFVQAPYGRWDLQLMDSHGGWVSSAPDLLKFVNRIDAPEAPLLPPAWQEVMVAPPTGRLSRRSAYWYGCGWNVRPPAGGDRHTIWHDGSLAGTAALLVRRHDGWSWAVLFNCDSCMDGSLCANRIDPLIHPAINQLPDRPDLRE